MCVTQLRLDAGRTEAGVIWKTGGLGRALQPVLDGLHSPSKQRADSHKQRADSHLGGGAQDLALLLEMQALPVVRSAFAWLQPSPKKATLVAETHPLVMSFLGHSNMLYFGLYLKTARKPAAFGLGGAALHPIAS